MGPERWNGVPLAAIGSGMYRAPDDLPELTRGLPDYEQRDPAELAAMRTRMGVIPQQGRPDITPEHAAQMLVAGAGAFAAPETLAMRGLAALPRAAGVPLAALGAYLYGTEQPNAEEKADPQKIMNEQRILKARNLYDGPIDGQEGPKTLAARAAAKTADDAAAATRETNELERKRIEAGNVAAGNESKRLELEQQKRADERTGNELFKTVDAAVPTWRKAFRDYAPAAGYVVGALGGMALRSKMVNRADDWVANRNANAEALFDEALGNSKAALNTKATRVNEFWRQGGAKELPFNTPPSGITANPGAPSTTALYPKPQSDWLSLKDLGAMGMMGGESAYGQYQLAGAEKELADARAALEKDKSPSNIDRLQAARDNEAWFSFLTTVGRGGGGSYFGKSTLRFRDQPQPNMSNAERELVEVQDALRTPPRTRASKAASPPTPSDNVERAEQWRKEQRRFTDQGESLGDILASATRRARDPRFMKPDL